MALALLLLLVVVPIVELYVIVQTAHGIGVLPTIGLLIVMSVLGSWLLKREGAKAWRAFRAATASGRVPAKETADGALVILGGALLLTPGFVTDVFGLLCILPPTRVFVRKALLSFFVGRMAGRVTVAGRPAGDLIGSATRRSRPTKVRSRRVPASDRRPANEPPPPPLPPE
jgi:UPF0716 protein FxsA